MITCSDVVLLCKTTGGSEPRPTDSNDKRTVKSEFDGFTASIVTFIFKRRETVVCQREN